LGSECVARDGGESLGGVVADRLRDSRAEVPRPSASPVQWIFQADAAAGNWPTAAAQILVDSGPRRGHRIPGFVGFGQSCCWLLAASCWLLPRLSPIRWVARVCAFAESWLVAAVEIFVWPVWSRVPECPVCAVSKPIPVTALMKRGRFLCGSGASSAWEPALICRVPYHWVKFHPIP
jgi:hypothetical protein